MIHTDWKMLPVVCNCHFCSTCKERRRVIKMKGGERLKHDPLVSVTVQTVNEAQPDNARACVELNRPGIPARSYLQGRMLA